jgi:hypothetical protein
MLLDGSIGLAPLGREHLLQVVDAPQIPLKTPRAKAKPIEK